MRQSAHGCEESARQKEEDEKRKLKKALKPFCQDVFGAPVVGLKNASKNMLHPDVYLEICKTHMLML